MDIWTSNIQQGEIKSWPTPLRYGKSSSGNTLDPLITQDYKGTHY